MLSGVIESNSFEYIIQFQSIFIIHKIKIVIDILHKQRILLGMTRKCVYGGWENSHWPQPFIVCAQYQKHIGF